MVECFFLIDREHFRHHLTTSAYRDRKTRISIVEIRKNINLSKIFSTKINFLDEIFFEATPIDSNTDVHHMHDEDDIWIIPDFEIV